MGWLFPVILITIFLVLAAILASNARGYKRGYADGYEECQLLEDVGVATNNKEGEHERIN